MFGPVAHIGITVPEMDAALTFNVDVLGMEKARRGDFRQSGSELSRADAWNGFAREEDTLIQTGAPYEHATEWRNQRPPKSANSRSGQ